MAKFVFSAFAMILMVAFTGAVIASHGKATERTKMSRGACDLPPY